MDSYVEFELPDPERFAMLARVYDALRTAKETGVFHDDEYWLAFFDERARAHFCWTSLDASDAWDFGSMIEAFQNGDYRLVGCEQIEPGRGRLEFRPLGWPYGGTACMHALIEAFGGRVTGEEE